MNTRAWLAFSTGVAFASLAGILAYIASPRAVIFPALFSLYWFMLAVKMEDKGE